MSEQQAQQATAQDVAKTIQQWLDEGARMILELPYDSSYVPNEMALEAWNTRALPQGPVGWRDFHDWWSTDGHAIDPEPDVSWYDKRRDFAEMAFNAALPHGPVGWRDGPDWKGFGQALVEDWPTADIDGSFLFDMALKHSVIREIPGGYDPDQHIDAEGICPEPGDPWYEYVPECVPGQPEQPSVAEAARDAIYRELQDYEQLDELLCCSGFDGYGHVSCGCQGVTLRDEIANRLSDFARGSK